MATINYATSYQAALDQAFTSGTYFGALRAAENNKTYKWVDAKTIAIPHLTTTGRVNADRDQITLARRNFDNSWENKTLSFHRTWSTLVHPMDIDETAMSATISNITNVFNTEQKLPEMDARLISKAYSDWTTGGKTADTTALTVNNVLDVFDNLMQAMDDAKVPEVGRILYVTPATDKLLKTASAIQRTLDVKNSKRDLIRGIRSIDDVQLVKVPSSLMKTAYTFTTGYAPATGAGQVNMFLIHPAAIITPVKYSMVTLDPPAAMTQGKWVYFEEDYEDVFLLNHKLDGVAFNITAASNASNNTEDDTESNTEGDTTEG
jgi:hypothetical protein